MKCTYRNKKTNSLYQSQFVNSLEEVAAVTGTTVDDWEESSFEMTCDEYKDIIARLEALEGGNP